MEKPKSIPFESWLNMQTKSLKEQLLKVKNKEVTAKTVDGHEVDMKSMGNKAAIDSTRTEPHVLYVRGESDTYYHPKYEPEKHYWGSAPNEDTKDRMEKLRRVNGGLKYLAYCFTSYDKDMKDRILQHKDKIGFLVMQLEYTRNNQYHWQGYVRWKTRMLFGTMLDINGKGHVICGMAIKGTEEHNRKYCSREWKEKFEKKGYTVPKRVMSEKPIIFGETRVSQQGERKDLIGMKEYVILNPQVSHRQMIDEFGDQYGRFHGMCAKVKEEVQCEIRKHKRKVKVLVLVGPPGIGKSHLVEESFPDAYKLKMGEQIWFDNYQGEEVLWLEEFRGQIKISELLQMLEGIKQQLNVKGGHTYANWTTVVITSNEEPKQWYPKVAKATKEALMTRITHIIECEGTNKRTETKRIKLNLDHKQMRKLNEL